MQQVEEGRIPPQAVEVEEKILGSILFEPQMIDVMIEHLVEHDLYRPAHQQMYHSMLNLYSKGEAIDMITVEEQMKSDGFEGSVNTVMDLVEHGGGSANLEYYCKIVKDKSMKRQLITGCSEIIKQCYDSTTDTDEVSDKAQEIVFAVTESKSATTMTSLSETMVKVMQMVSDIQESGKPLGLRTGLDIDKTLNGFQDAKLYVIGARPSMGKTALVMTFLRRFAREEIGSGILSLETSDEALGIRLVGQVADLEASKISSGEMTAEEMNRFSNAVGELSRLKIFIDDEAAISAQKMRAKCRLMYKRGARIIFIDFLQLMQAEGRTKHEEIGTLTKTAKAVSKELGIPIVLLSQLNRKIEDRTDKRPQMADLRESGSIEEDADGIIFLYRPEYYGIETMPDGRNSKGIAEIIIAKNKDGKTGLKELRFIDKYMRFENAEHFHEERPLAPPVPHFNDTDDDKPF